MVIGLASLLGAQCGAGQLTPLQFQAIGVWILEGGFLKELERHPQTNQVQKVVLPPVDGSQPSIAYLRMPVWRAHQVQALNLQDKVQPLESIERFIPPRPPEDN